MSGLSDLRAGLGKRARARALASLAASEGVVAASRVPALPLPATLPYVVVDVFVDDDRAFTGNPLAVVFDSDGLSVEHLQALAREFNLSETAFPQRPSEAGRAAGADYLLRIFTPEVELPFAGHPSVGAAWASAVLHRAVPRPVTPTGQAPSAVVAGADGAVGAGARALRQECGAGVLTLTLHEGGAIELAGGAAQAGPELDPGPLLAAIGLTDDDAAPGLAPRRCSAGLPWTFLPVRPDALARARPDVTAQLALRPESGGGDLMVVSWDGSLSRARGFAAAAGVPEDPATGSAGVAFGVFLAASRLVGEGTSSYRISQGVEMGRPSVLTGSVTVRDGAVVATSIAGRVAPVARGEISLPRLG